MVLPMMLPIGSKVVASNLGFNFDKTSRPCKVIGYAIETGNVLVYNPEIDGHSGNRMCKDNDGKLIQDSDIFKTYGKHCWYIDPEDMSGW